MRRRQAIWLGLGAIVLGAAMVIGDPTELRATSDGFAQIEGDLNTRPDRGAAYFTYGDFGALDSAALQVSASPWRLAVAALALQEVEGDPTQVGEVDLAALFQRYGFLTPAVIANWPDTVRRPDVDTPLGQNTGLATGSLLPLAVTIGNINCATCHAGVMYDEDGRADPTRVWLGSPNTSVNPEHYADALFTAFRDQTDDPDRLFAAMDTLFPEMDWQERLTLRWFVLPQVRGVVAERDAAQGRLLPYRLSLPGATNGLDALRRGLGFAPDGVEVTESVFNSVPDLGDRVFRTTLLNTGIYAIPDVAPAQPLDRDGIDDLHLDGLAGIVAYFTVPSMGVTPEVADAHIAETADVLRWMAEYRPQPFPGAIDESLAIEGAAVYARDCAACHGDYGEDPLAPGMVSFPNWQGDVGTDPERSNLFTAEIAEAIETSSYGPNIDVRLTEGYAAPPLTGLWSSAPYLHNGSVPTLWHLLRPEIRPERFFVGGHDLDLDLVGIAGEVDGQGGWIPLQDHVPWTLNQLIDTSAFGLGNQGHEAPFDELSESELDALLEYLKLL